MANPKLIIELTDNGAVVEFKGHLDFNEGKSFKQVYKFDEENKEGLVELLYDINNFCFVDQGKYSKELVSIELIHGSAYECKDKKQCTICNKDKSS